MEQSLISGGCFIWKGPKIQTVKNKRYNHENSESHDAYRYTEEPETTITMCFFVSASWFNAQEALMKSEQMDVAKQQVELLIQKQQDQRSKLLGRSELLFNMLAGDDEEVTANLAAAMGCRK